MSTKNTNKNTNINENKIVIELPKVIRRKSKPRPKKTFAQAEEELNDLENKDRQYQKTNYGQGLSGINPNIKISFNPSLYGFNKTPMEVPPSQPQPQPQAEPQPQPQAEPQAEPQQEQEQTTTQSEPSAPQFGAFKENDLSNRSGFNDLRKGFSQSYSAPQFNRQDFQDRMNAEIPVAEAVYEDKGYATEGNFSSRSQLAKRSMDIMKAKEEAFRATLKEEEENRKRRGRRAGQPNRTKEEIDAEKQAKEEKKKDRTDRRKANEEIRLKKEKANEEALVKATEETRLKKEKEQKAVEENMRLIKDQEQAKKEKAEQKKTKEDKKKEKEERKGMKGEDKPKTKGSFRTVSVDL
jgi:hypothetical protein